MQRRNFFKTVLAGVSAFFGVRRAKAQEVRRESIHELAAVVLPSSLGKDRTEKVADDFVRWFGEYKAGAQVASGYGHPRTQVTGASPAANYAAQLQALGSPITREAVEKALEAANVARIPTRPDGKHIAADLLAYFYGSSAGEDFLYNVAIKREDCRGLANSAQRPASLS